MVVDRLGAHAGFGSVSLYLSDDQEPSIYHRRAFAGDEPEQTLSPRTDNVLLTMLRIERRQSRSKTSQRGANSPNI